MKKVETQEPSELSSVKGKNKRHILYGSVHSSEPKRLLVQRNPLACMLRHADTYIRRILMTLLPHKALTTLTRFQKRLRLHIVENEEKYFCLRHHFFNVFTCPH